MTYYGSFTEKDDVDGCFKWFLILVSFWPTNLLSKVYHTTNFLYYCMKQSKISFLYCILLQKIKDYINCIFAVKRPMSVITENILIFLGTIFQYYFSRLNSIKMKINLLYVYVDKNCLVWCFLGFWSW